MRRHREGAEPAQKDEAVSPENPIDYEGPQTPEDREWSLLSLNGGGAAEASHIALYHDKGEPGVGGGCLGFYIVRELKEDRTRVVKLGLQVGRLDCGRPEGVQRQAGSIVGIMRNLDDIRVTENRFELRSEFGRIAAFVPPAPAQIDPALAGTKGLPTSLEGEELVPGIEITLKIDKEMAGGCTSCNFYGGDVDKMANGSVVWSGASGMTTVGCADDRRRQETRCLNLLDVIEAYRIKDGRLEMIDGDGRTTLVFRQEVQWRSDPAQPVGTSWVLRSTDREEPLQGSVPTDRFDSEKTNSWYDRCQNFEDRYSVTENDLTMPVYGLVGGRCMNPKAYRDSAGPCVVACFEPEGNYRLRDGLLEIRSEAGESASILEPIAGGEEPEQEGTL